MLGYVVFRVRETSEKNEFVVLNTEQNKYNCYSEKRAKEILIAELERSKKINIREWILTVLPEYQDRKFNVRAILSMWFDEEYILVDSMGYKPCSERVFVDTDKKYFNSYSLSSLESDMSVPAMYDSVNPDISSWSDIHALIYNLCGKSDDYTIYFTKWLAWQVQNPLHRLPTSIVFQGEPGTGKTKFCELVLGRIFGSNFTEISQVDLDSQFNSFVYGKRMIVADEVIQSISSSVASNKLKSYVSNEYVSVNRKFFDTQYLRNYSHWIFCTNNLQALRIERFDRRYSVFKSRKLLDGTGLIQNLLDHPEQVNSFYRYLLELEVSFGEVSVPLETEARENLISLSKNSVEHFADAVVESGSISELYQDVKSCDDYTHLEKSTLPDGDYLKVSSAYAVYVLFCRVNGFRSTLTRHKFTRTLHFLGHGLRVCRVGDNVHRTISDVRCENV